MKLVLQEEQDEVAAAATTTEAELERGGAEARKEDCDRPDDGTASLVGGINLRAHNSTTNTLERLSVQSLDDELDDVDSDVEEGASSSVLPPATVANRMKSASNTLSNLAADVSSSAERGARSFLGRQSNIDKDGARMIADLESQVDALQEAFQTAEDHVVTLEGKLTDAASDRKKTLSVSSRPRMRL
jgi:chromosome segregation ATPase